ncbi:MAG: hypothetical protein HYZ95_02955 [Candidatus Omnitrophica bacterium]|nr:hypothetical protein [Candidatus Omnitrophota bacterium]
MTAAALLVAFGSSQKRRSSEEEAFLLSRQVERLTQARDALEEKLRWTEGRYAQSMALGKELNRALLAERQRSGALSQQLREDRQTPDS